VQVTGVELLLVRLSKGHKLTLTTEGEFAKKFVKIEPRKNIMQVYGVVHLKSLPGSPTNRLSIDEIIDSAQEDVNSLIYGGVDGIIIENFGDTPFVKDDISKRTLASFTTVVENLSIERDIKIGINVLRNDGIAALCNS
jgi:predicted TIM-barrel enzyme